MNDDDDHALDALLRAQFDGPVPDDGFSAAVMDRLPARPRPNNWPTIVGIVGGIALCWLALSSSTLANVGVQDWIAGRLSAPAAALLISIAAMAMLALAWTIAELDELSPRADRRMMR